MGAGCARLLHQAAGGSVGVIAVEQRRAERWIGVGGDPVKGTRYADLIPFYARDAQTEGLLIIGEIGGHERNAPDAWRFSIDVARAWEDAVRGAVVPSTRKVLLRSAVTMSPDSGGPFDTLLGLVRRGLGGTAGDGRQFVSWVHHDDFTRAVLWLIEHDDIEGAVNIAAPEPLPNAEFMRVLREAWGAAMGLSVTGWVLELGAVLMRTETELVLKSRRVVPARLLDRGFRFCYSRWADAARDLVASRAA